MATSSKRVREDEEGPDDSDGGEDILERCIADGFKKAQESLVETVRDKVQFTMHKFQQKLKSPKKKAKKVPRCTHVWKNGELKGERCVRDAEEGCDELCKPHYKSHQGSLRAKKSRAGKKLEKAIPSAVVDLVEEPEELFEEEQKDAETELSQKNKPLMDALPTTEDLDVETRMSKLGKRPLINVLPSGPVIELGWKPDEVMAEIPTVDNIESTPEDEAETEQLLREVHEAMEKRSRNNSPTTTPVRTPVGPGEPIGNKWEFLRWMFASGSMN